MPFIPAIGVAALGAAGVMGPATLGAATMAGIGTVGALGYGAYKTVSSLTGAMSESDRAQLSQSASSIQSAASTNGQSSSPGSSMNKKPAAVSAYGSNPNTARSFLLSLNPKP